MTVTSPPIPLQVGEFRLEEKIGQGGICEVYRAYQPSLDRRVAVKILRPHHLNDPELRRRFVREAKILARLSHPNIIHVIDAGAEGDWAWYAMDYIEGIDFKAILQENSSTLSEKLDIIIQTLKGLEYAHNNAVVHRDLKPANIMVDKGGNAHLADFGIAHLFAGVGETDATQTGELMGTPAYMAPEQKSSAKYVDERSDIFSMGVILYETLTGKKPYGLVRRPSEANPVVTTVLDEIALKCLEGEPADRYQSVTELKDRLLEAAPRPGTASAKPEPVFSGVDNFVGRCKFLDTLQETPSTVSYLVENTGDHQLYVIKKISGRDIELGFLRRLAVLKHSHILNVYGAGSDLQKTVVVTDYARGGSLADRLARRWSDEEVTRFIYEAATALDFAHKNNIVHGNLRPSNFLFDENDSLLVADFGLPPAANKRRPWWRAPENQLSREADLFSLGAVAYHMLYGDRPRWFSDSHLHIPKTQNFVSREIRRLLTGMLHQNPDKRSPSTEEIARLLRPETPDAARSASQQTTIRERQIPVWVWIVVSLAAVLGGAALAYWKLL